MWSLGVLIGLPIAGLIVLGCLGAIVFGMMCDARELIGGAIIGVVTTGVITGFAMWPWDPSYHQWKTYTGPVAASQLRMVSDGKTTTQVVSVVFANGDERRCDDTRCTTLVAGDILSLTCKRDYQFNGTPGWVCNYVGVKRAS